MPGRKLQNGLIIWNSSGPFEPELMVPLGLFGGSNSAAFSGPRLR
jgi:hypothetical protein